MSSGITEGKVKLAPALDVTEPVVLAKTPLGQSSVVVLKSLPTQTYKNMSSGPQLRFRLLKQR